jgi:hypothetical protein
MSFGTTTIEGPEGYRDFWTEVFLSQNGDEGVCLEVLDGEDGWREFLGVLHPDEADAIADALKKAAEAQREIWAGRPDGE